MYIQAVGSEVKNKKTKKNPKKNQNKKQTPYLGAPTFGRNRAFQEGLSSKLEKELFKIFAAAER